MSRADQPLSPPDISHWFPMRDAARFPNLTRAGADIRAFRQTVNAVCVIRGKYEYLLITRSAAPVTLFTTEDRSTLDWVDFSIELIAGMVALMLGISLGKRGYQALKPVVYTLWQDQGFRQRIELVGQRTLADSPLSVGVAVTELWRYIWREHQATLFRGIMGAIGGVIGPRALMLALLRWLARLVSGGAAMAIEIGALILPLGNKLRHTSGAACH